MDNDIFRVVEKGDIKSRVEADDDVVMGLRLIKAYERIVDPAKRLEVVTMIESFADEKRDNKAG